MIKFEDYQIYKDELKQITIELDGDPGTMGVGTLNAKIAQVHAQKERVASVLCEAIANVYERERTYEEINQEYQREFDQILNSDETIQKLKSDTLRKAAVNARMSDSFAKTCAAKIDLNDAEGFQKYVQTRFNILDSANQNISRQITVVDLQLQLGEIERKGDGFGEGGGAGSRKIGVKKHA